MNKLSTSLMAGLLLVVTSGCADPEASRTEVPPLHMETRADTLAVQVYEALGGAEAWAALPYLRFDFASEQEGQRRPPRKHLWDRRTGHYRLEMQNAGGDTTFVTLFNVNTQEGEAFANGTPLDSARSNALVRQAYRSFINDTYWMLAPVKMMDPGVNREYVADSSTAEYEVVRLTFGQVGLTPGDQYWLYVNPNTHRVDQWAYVLQGNPDAPPSPYRWTGYEQLDTPEGPVYIATRKEAVGRPHAINTDGLEAPAQVPRDLFTDPKPRL